MGTSALAATIAKAKSKVNKPSAKKSSKPKSTSSAKKEKRETATGTITPRIQHPWKKIKEMYEAGKTKEETAKALKIKVTSMNGIMDRLVRGVEVDGKVIRIVRSKKSKE